MTTTVQSYSELKAHYIAVKKRLGGLGPSAGLVPIAAVRPQPPQPVIAPLCEIAPSEPLNYRFRTPKLPRNQFFHILVEVATKHEVTPDELIGHNRRAKIVWIRREVIWRAVKEQKYSIARVARWLQKDHTTIIHDLRRWAERYEIAA